MRKPKRMERKKEIQRTKFREAWFVTRSVITAMVEMALISVVPLEMS